MDEEIRPDWYRLLPFTTHRMHVGGGLFTAPDGPEPEVDARIDVVLKAVGGSLAGKTLVDLGSNEGGFAVAFACLGARHVVGIECRAISVERSRLLAALRGVDATTTFIEGDVDKLLPTFNDPFDVVFATGLLYHVANPFESLRVMRAACGGVALIDTHIADRAAPSHGCTPNQTTLRTSHTVYTGRDFPEFDPATSESDRAGMLWASFQNPTSFWPYEDELIRMIHDAGFSSAERVEPSTMKRHWAVDPINRVMYVCTP